MRSKRPNNTTGPPSTADARNGPVGSTRRVPSPATLLRPRQSQGKGRTLSCPGMRLDRAAVFLDDSSAEGQTQARAGSAVLRGRFGGKEGIEDPVQIFRRDAGSGVDDLNSGPLLRFAGPDGQLAGAAKHGLPG